MMCFRLYCPICSAEPRHHDFVLTSSFPNSSSYAPAAFVFLAISNCPGHNSAPLVASAQRCNRDILHDQSASFAASSLSHWVEGLLSIFWLPPPPPPPPPPIHSCVTAITYSTAINRRVNSRQSLVNQTSWQFRLSSPSFHLNGYSTQSFQVPNRLRSYIPRSTV